MPILPGDGMGWRGGGRTFLPVQMGIAFRTTFGPTSSLPTTTRAKLATLRLVVQQVVWDAPAGHHRFRPPAMYAVVNAQQGRSTLWSILEMRWFQPRIADAVEWFNLGFLWRCLPVCLLVVPPQRWQAFGPQTSPTHRTGLTSPERPRYSIRVHKDFRWWLSTGVDQQARKVGIKSTAVSSDGHGFRRACRCISMDAPERFWNAPLQFV